MSILHRMLSVLRRRDRVYHAYQMGVDAGVAIALNITSGEYQRGHADGCQDGLSVGYDRGWIDYDNDAVCQRIRNRNLTEAYTNGHSDGCQDGYTAGFYDGIESDDFYLRCPICGTEELQSIACEDGEWKPGAWDARTDKEIDPLCGTCAKHVDTNDVYHHPTTQYPDDPLAPPTRQDSADDAIATITDLMRHGG